MQATKVIGKFDGFKNAFTRYGRNKNYLIQQLKDSGFSEFRERTLKDKSQVLLAYEKGKDLAEYAFRLYPDLSMEKKRTGTRYALFSIPIKIKNVSKTFTNKFGNTIKEISKKLRYENNIFVEKEERINDLNKDVLIVKEELPRGVNDPNLELKGIVKSYSRLKDNDIYSFYQLADGTKHYIKNIGGVEYKYSTK